MPVADSSVLDWAAKIGGRHGRFASWITGWFNLLGALLLIRSFLCSIN